MDVRHKNLLGRGVFLVFIVVGIVVFPQHFFKICGIRNIRVDAQGTDGLSGAVVKIDGGRPQKMPIFSIGGIIECILRRFSVEDLQAQIRNASANLPARYLPIFNSDDRMVVRRHKIMKHDLAIFPEMLCHQLHHVFQQFFLLIHGLHSVFSPF